MLYGNLLTLPVGDGLLYVQPLYALRAERRRRRYPMLQFVLVSFGEKVGIGTTLTEALDDVLGRRRRRHRHRAGTAAPAHRRQRLRRRTAAAPAGRGSSRLRRRRCSPATGGLRQGASRGARPGAAGARGGEEGDEAQRVAESPTPSATGPTAAGN